jgi:PAS domain S-box-containing protein
MENPRILIVDEEASHADAIRRAFRKECAEATIRVAGTLREYRQAVASEPPDIVLMELNLPDGSAFDILESPEGLRPFPVLVMTDRGNEQKAVEAMKSGAIDFVVKSRDAFAAMPHTVVHALREWDLLRERKLFWDILACIDEAIVVIDRDYRIVSANRAFCEQAGMPFAALTGRHCYEICHHLTHPCHEVYQNCACKRTFETGEPALFVETNTDENGDQTHLETKTFAMKDETGNIKSIIEVINDITEKTNLEAQLRHSQKMEAIGTLAGGVAHDFNNVLSAVIGYGYLALLKMGPDDPLREDIENILEGADRAAKLTKDLLVFSRKQICEKGPVDLNEIIRHVEKFLTRVIGDDVICKVALHGEPIVVLADTHQIEQVLMNLATNARDAMVKGGHIIISSEPVSVKKSFITRHGYGKSGKYALLTFSDTGEGMVDETRRKIFDPFFTTKESGKGTGLGLSVVYGIVKQHEGYINVYSEPGFGTSFKIYLPIISSEAGEEEKAYEESIPSHGTETILLAEDDETMRGLVRILLEKQGYRVIEAADGADAVKRFMEYRETIDLLLFDLIMPKMNGKDAYDEIKQWRPGLKVIFASGYAPDIVREKMCFEPGIVMISKPINSYALLKKIRTLLDEDKK